MLRGAATVAGELMVTAAVVIALFLGWKLWWFDAVTADAQSAAAEERLEALPSIAGPAALEPIVAKSPRRQGSVIGVLRVPRFGAGSARTIAEGTTTDQLNSSALGVGHYPATAMPGAIGNFAIAGHRSAYGGALHRLDRLRPGDAIVVDTAAGRYRYAFRSMRTVEPGERAVLAAVPGRPRATPTQRLITLTTCTPLYSTAQRLVAVGELTSFTPRED